MENRKKKRREQHERTFDKRVIKKVVREREKHKVCAPTFGKTAQFGRGPA